jgi:glycosyltransferase involved in cell wall biosynthesis
MFEAMAMERPLVIGVDGESRQIVEDGQCGIYIEPENHEELARVVLKLYHDRELLKTMGENGKSYVENNYNREILAKKYLNTLLDVYGNHTTNEET